MINCISLAYQLEVSDMQSYDSYAVKISLPALSDVVLEKCNQVASDAITGNQFHEFPGYRSTEKFAKIDGKLPEIDALVNDSDWCTGALIMLLPPEFVMDVHIDIYYLKARKCAILIPIMPRADIAPTLFYETEHSKQASRSIDWHYGQPQLLNVKPHWHNVINNGHWRGMLQLNFSLDYEEIVQKINDGCLFRTAKCECI